MLIERVVFDSAVLLGDKRLHAIATVDLGYVRGYWSSWIVSEIVRQRTEWIAERAAQHRCDRAETRRRLDLSRSRVNALIVWFSRVLVSVDYHSAPDADLSWLADPDDWPVMQTALAARADALVTDNSRDFPLGQERHGVLFLSTTGFLATVYKMHPDAEAAVRRYLGEANAAQYPP